MVVERLRYCYDHTVPLGVFPIVVDRAASTSRLSPLFGGPSKNVPRPTAVVRSKEGDQLSEGDLLCEIETDKATMGFETPEEGYLAKIIIHEGSKDIPVGKVRLGVTGSGPGGRVLAADLAKAPDSAAAQAESTPAAPGGDYTDIPVSNMRRTIAKRLTASKTTIPHYYLTAEINIDSLLKVREKLNTLLAQGTSNGKTKISVNDFIVKGLATISSEIKELAARAKDGKLQPNEFQGGTFTVSNLGMFGSVTDFTAIINPPQSCILAIGGAETKLVPCEEQGCGNLEVPTVGFETKAYLGVVAMEELVDS
ncbi:2-oxo acid dehydrogenase acyltransferase [Teladorsagia circumcincta]|uniref:Dihydrolipoamide acetyltransferase component of pyruvate dehydrogenase complex n=1 Tax=Teladorsagia circumcincta TaxID=45464 RepID=A0A2G9UVG7_TELCI|nr:2-oxo acid dehydrogenase acyltransferase [Teladorsagia circumcincta]